MQLANSTNLYYYVYYTLCINKIVYFEVAMYYYIAEHKDRIVLRSTADILSLPDGVEVVDRQDIHSYFPKDSHQMLTHNIVSGKHVGQYILPVDISASPNILFKYDNAVNLYAQHVTRKQQAEITYRLGHATKTILHNAVTGVNITMCKDIQWQGFNTTISELLGRGQHSLFTRQCDLLEVLSAKVKPQFDVAIESLCSHIANTTSIQFLDRPSKIIADARRSIARQLEEREGHRHRFFVLDLAVKNTNSMVRFEFEVQHLQYILENTLCSIDLSAVWIEDTDNVVKDIASNAANDYARYQTRLITWEIDAAIKRIVYPSTEFKFNESCTLKPFDRTKKSKLGFFKTINQLKLHSTLKTVRRELAHFKETYQEKLNAFGVSSAIRQYGIHGTSLHKCMVGAAADAAPSASSAIDIQSYRELITSAYGQKAIRTKLFAALRKELHYASKTKVKETKNV